MVLGTMYSETRLVAMLIDGDVFISPQFRLSRNRCGVLPHEVSETWMKEQMRNRRSLALFSAMP